MTNTKYGFPAWVAGTTRGLVLALALATAGAWAGDDIDQDEALELRQAGEILPLERILELADQHVQGRLIKAELEREEGRLIYELEYLDGGEVWEVSFDAATGEFLERERD